MNGRTPQIIGLLLSAHMSARQIMMASEGFRKPYRSMSMVRADLLKLLREGLLARQAIPAVGPGEPERLYFLTRQARRIAPELADVPRNASTFRPVPLSRLEHALGVAQFVCLLHRDVARSQGRAKLLRVLRDRELSIQVDPRAYGLKEGLLIPDGTVLLELGGQLQLLFLELMNRGAVTRPGVPASIVRSFAAKLWRYKALVKHLGESVEMRSLLAEHGRSLPPGFRVLVVGTRSPVHLEHLREAAKDFRTLCYFSRLVELELASMLTEPVWQLPTGKHRAIVDRPALEKKRRSD